MKYIYVYTILFSSCVGYLNYKQKEGENELWLKKNITSKEIELFLSNLDSTNEISFYAITHPELSDVGVDWKVRVKDTSYIYTLWNRIRLTDWEKITKDSLLHVILNERKYENRVITLEKR